MTISDNFFHYCDVIKQIGMIENIFCIFRNYLMQRYSAAKINLIIHYSIKNKTQGRGVGVG